jgi:hypothetical protein
MKKSILVSSCCSVAAVSALVGSIVFAQDQGAQMQLPPGWTMEDVQACMAAGTPGEMHKHLLESVGSWDGKTSMVMAPNAPAIESTCTTTVTSIMDGRYVQVDVAGEMPGMGPYKGMYIYGFDNVSQEFVATAIDNMGTGVMHGTGELSADGKTLTTNYTYNCPITKKPAVMREVETITGPKTKKLEMYTNDPKSGKEYKMMTIELTKK